MNFPIKSICDSRFIRKDGTTLFTFSIATVPEVALY
jgi:hypothetical protein